MMNKINWKLVAVGIVCLTIIQVCAMFNGINGTFRTLIVGLIAVAIGITLPLDKFIKSE